MPPVRVPMGARAAFAPQGVDPRFTLSPTTRKDAVLHRGRRTSVTTNMPEFAAALNAKAIGTSAQAIAVTRHYTYLLLERTRENASGRPGPNVITGEYRAAFRATFRQRLHLYEGLVSNEKPQALRLEFGFVGYDALGRYYNQPPFPHMRPAFEETRYEYAAAMLAIGARLR